MNYYIPQWESDLYGFRRVDPYAKLFEDRIIFLGTRSATTSPTRSWRSCCACSS
jgi:hypothetical protein